MSFIFRPTYKLKRGPSPTTTQIYSSRCTQQYTNLLSQDDVDEPCLQTYFEQHPAMLLQIVGHCPMHCSLITQPDLIGTYIRRPDFMMIAKDSGEWRPILIEIESPEKRIFTKDGKTRSDFNHARDQLTEWRSWFRDHSNVDQFKERYGIPNYIERELMMRMETVLIYGRRSEFDGNPNLTKFRASLMKPSEHLMSFDRLSSLKMNDLDCQIAMTIKPTGSGHFQAVWVPETFSLGPEFADRLHYISGIESAIYNNPNISDERKRFLVERIDYWKTWSRSNSGTYVGGHRE